MYMSVEIPTTHKPVVVLRWTKYVNHIKNIWQFRWWYWFDLENDLSRSKVMVNCKNTLFLPLFQIQTSVIYSNSLNLSNSDWKHYYGYHISFWVTYISVSKILVTMETNNRRQGFSRNDLVIAPIDTFSDISTYLDDIGKWWYVNTAEYR